MSSPQKSRPAGCTFKTIRLMLPIWLVLVSGVTGGELQKFVGCTLVATDWADGDSFSVKFPDGKTQTVRLYGADCIEIHLGGDKANAERLRDQRRYFGIGEILVAKSFGEAAKLEAYQLLSKPFIVHTTFADGRGDARFPRIYGFVETSDGADLSETLISKGLARAFGVRHRRADGTSAEEWRLHLADLELTAARAGRGAWSKTNWEELPNFRKEARDELAEIEEAKGNGEATNGKLIDINHAARDELVMLPGIAEKFALRIIEGRPYQRTDDLLKVNGIGPATLEKIKDLIVIGPP